MNNIKKTFRAGFVIAAGFLAMHSCTDTWDDHYDAALSSLKYDGTTMQALENMAPDFAKVVKLYGYDRELTSDNIYTVWAPADGSFNLEDYAIVTDNGDGTQTLEQKKEAKEIVDQFIKNHIARYSLSLNSTDQTFMLMNEKKTTMTADGKFGTSDISKEEGQFNVSCRNGLVHIIDGPSPYSYNLFELIAKQYKEDPSEDKDKLSLYAFLYSPENNKDSLIENKSVSRGVDENGEKIWVDSFVMRNNTVLKNVDAKLYEEDSSFIAILPTAKAWAERYNEAKSLLVFNPSEDQRIDGACDSLQNHYATMFAMNDLFFNKNANEFWQDSLKSTIYQRWRWYEHVYYSQQPKHMPEDGRINDILAKCGEPIACSNGEGYIVDEYPMSIFEQFFKPIKTWTINEDENSSGKPQYSKNFNMDAARQRKPIIFTSTILGIDPVDDEEGGEGEDKPSGEITENTKTERCIFTDFVPTSGSPIIGFDVSNTLSGTYDIFVVTCPIWMGKEYNDVSWDDLPGQPYRFKVNIFERENSGKNLGKYPTSATKKMKNPFPKIDPKTGKPYSDQLYITSGKAFGKDGHPIVNDTIYIGEYQFKNAYYGRNDEGVIIQLEVSIGSTQTSDFSREMLISNIILKPHDPDAAPIVVEPEDTDDRTAKMRKANKSIKFNIKEYATLQ